MRALLLVCVTLCGMFCCSFAFIGKLLLLVILFIEMSFVIDVRQTSSTETDDIATGKDQWWI